MNLDLLTKLVKLANHNPNENEANSAARKVCKLIEEANFNFNGRAPVAPPKVTIKPPTTWKDVTRSTEPGFRAHRDPRPYSNPEYEDWFRKFWEKEANFTKKANETDKEKYSRPFYTGPNTRAKKDKRPLKCTECGNMIETAFIGVEATFVCHTCIWLRFNERHP